MPSQKSRSKEDTWTTKELDSALNDDRERQRRERREKRERKEKASASPRGDMRNTKERAIRDDKVEKKQSRDSDDKRRDRPMKDDRQREVEREERRRKREGGDETKGSSRHRNEDDRRRREKDREEPIAKISSRHKSDERKKSDRHRSNDVRDDDRRRRDKQRESEDRKISDRHKERDGDDRRRRHKREEDAEDKRREERHRRKQENGDDERERRRKGKREEEEREKKMQERRGNKESSSLRSRVVENDSEKENGRQSEEEDEENGNDYNYDNDDFEDYEEDFEEDDDDKEEEEKPQNMNAEDREMSDLLKALDEENARLAAGSVSSNKSDYSDQSHDNHDSKNSQKPISRGRTVINFVSAKQRAADQKVSNKTRKRGKDLLNLIEFDRASFDIFELPPVNEYELYIRSFGRTDMKQAYIQTNEDNLDRDIQTEEVELLDKWTQYPADDLLGCGGDNVESVKQELKIPASEIDSTRMISFFSKAAQAIGILLNEESTNSNEDGENGIKSNLTVSDGYHQLGTPLILKDRFVTCANYSPSQPNYLITCYSMPSIDSQFTSIRKGIVCVWNVLEPSNPQKYLASESQPNCCCFSPNRTSLVCAGMTDGSLVIWDLRENGFMHRMIKLDLEEYLFRFPTYNTAGVSESENHHSPVQSLVPVFPDPTSSPFEEETDNSGLSFQLASVEKNGFVNLWVVTEIPSPDAAGSEVDLGLSPGGRIKLVKSSSIKINSPLKLDKGDNLQAFEFKLSTCDLNHFYVGTDTGYVIHGVRFGSSAFPRGYTSVIDTPIKVKTIDFSPFGYPYLLAGCSDGSVHLYHTKVENPLVSWNDLSDGQSSCIQSVRWSRSRAAVFFVLDDHSTLYTFDLLEGDSRPVHVDKITSGKAVYMTLNNDSRILGSGLTQCPQLLLALDNGSTELHSIKQNLTEDKTLEGEFLKKFNERF